MADQLLLDHLSLGELACGGDLASACSAAFRMFESLRAKPWAPSMGPYLKRPKGPY